MIWHECKTDEDLIKINALAHPIWHSAYPGIITEEQIRYMLEKNYSFPALREQASNGQSFILFGDSLDEPSGFLGYTHENEHTLFINKFYILSHLQGKGIGKSAFAALLQKEPQTRTITLQVNRQNYKAINFYFSVGFRIAKVADFNIGNGYQMNDFIMAWHKPQS